MIRYLGEMDDVGLWFAAVVAGLTALGWVVVRLRRAWKAGRVWAQKAKAVLTLAELELQPNGGATIKDTTTRVPQLEQAVRDVQTSLNEQKAALDEHLALSLKGSEKTGDRIANIEAAVAYLAEALPTPRQEAS